MARSTFTTWIAWQKAFSSATSISRMARVRFPKYEQYSLTDQVRRSSRSVCSNLAESFGKRRYPKHFIAKLTDAQSENYETQNWLLFAEAEGYISEEVLETYLSKSEEVGKLLSYMEKNPDQYMKFSR